MGAAARRARAPLPLIVVFTAAARDDVFEVQDWYAERSAQVGRRLRRALDRAVFGVAQNPLGFPVVWRGRVRRALVLDRFPYALYFTVDDDQVIVIAWFHASRPNAAGRNARDGCLDVTLRVSAQPLLKPMSDVRRST